MPKPHRGKSLASQPSRGRGTCPVCKAARIKVLYDIVLEEGKNIKVCKRCQHKKADEVMKIIGAAGVKPAGRTAEASSVESKSEQSAQDESIERAESTETAGSPGTTETTGTTETGEASETA